MKHTNKQANLAQFLEPEIESFPVSAAPINSVYRVTIDDDVKEVRQFAELVDVLDGAQEGDVVQIRLSTNGGALHAIIPLMNSMKHTEAHVHVHVESDCSSAGTMIMMLADSCYVNEYATVMIHTCQYGYGGHAGNMDAHVSYTTKAVEKLVKEVYADWLDEDEIERVLDGKEFWFDAEECMMRFDIREEIRLEREAAEEEAEAAREEALAANPYKVSPEQAAAIFAKMEQDNEEE
jgi:ATP-dependent protease ClpP protease subunit